MVQLKHRILIINGGSSSIKFALFEAGDSLRRILEGVVERIGLPEATFRVKGLEQSDNFTCSVTAPDYKVAVRVIHTDEELRIAKTVCGLLGLLKIKGELNT